jgi:hypothetical protein
MCLQPPESGIRLTSTIVVVTPRLVRRLVAGAALPADLAASDPPGRWARRIPDTVVSELAGLCTALAQVQQKFL